MKNNIYVISNDKIFEDHNGNLYGPNNDLDNILSSLKLKFQTFLIARKTNKKNLFKVDGIKIFNKTNFKKNMKILMISLTPYNFFFLIFLIYLKRINVNGHVYLRSDGFLEYKYRYWWFGYFIYYLMFNIAKRKLKILSCSNNFTNIKKQSIIYPSEIDDYWLTSRKEAILDKVRFLYVGRYTFDKGGSFIKRLFFENKYKNFIFSIVGIEKNVFDSSQVSHFKFHGTVSSPKEMIKIYDECNIFLLPSLIEGFPKVINESLARLRPVIIFNEINYVKNNREGIFECKRDIQELFKMSEYILKNYEEIQKKILNDKHFTKKEFQENILEKIQ